MCNKIECCDVNGTLFNVEYVEQENRVLIGCKDAASVTLDIHNLRHLTDTLQDIVDGVPMEKPNSNWYFNTSSGIHFSKHFNSRCVGIEIGKDDDAYRLYVENDTLKDILSIFNKVN